MAKNIEIEYRSGGGDVNRLPALAKELIVHNVDLIVAMGQARHALPNRSRIRYPLSWPPWAIPLKRDS